MDNMSLDDSSQNNQIDFPSVKGVFAWESIIESLNIAIPVIYRCCKKYAAYKLVEMYVFPFYYSDELHSELKTFEFIPKYEMTRHESKLFTEINQVHCDSKFHVTFKTNDLMVCTDDIRSMLDYLEMIYKKLTHGLAFNAPNFGLMEIRNDDHVKKMIMPCIKRDEAILIPRNLLEKKPALRHLEIICLTAIESQYLKFLYRVMDIKTEQVEECVLLSDYSKKTNVNYEEYWPESSSYEDLLSTAASTG